MTFVVKKRKNERVTTKGRIEFEVTEHYQRRSWMGGVGGFFEGGGDGVEQVGGGGSTVC